MARYIDADVILAAKNPYDDELSEWERGWNDACDALAKDAPTADAVEVVRCKDCKHKEGSACDYSAVYVRPNGYCFYGERRDDD